MKESSTETLIWNVLSSKNILRISCLSQAYLLITLSQRSIGKVAMYSNVSYNAIKIYMQVSKPDNIDRMLLEVRKVSSQSH